MPSFQSTKTTIVSTSQRFLLLIVFEFLMMIVLVFFIIVLYNHILSASYIIAPVIEIQDCRTA